MGVRFKRKQEVVIKKVNNIILAVTRDWTSWVLK